MGTEDVPVIYDTENDKIEDLPDATHVGMNEEDEKVTIIRKAIQCAWDIQNEMNNKKITSNVSSLSVKVSYRNWIFLL